MESFTIFGYGYVGEAYAEYLVDYGYYVGVCDPQKGHKQALGHFASDGAIVCVNAPTLEDGTVDHGNVLSVIANIRKHNASMPILIKSTILPDIAEEIEDTYDNVTYSPEFLTAANARWDVEDCDSVVLAGQNPQPWADLFADLGKSIHLTDMRTASFMKYAVNTFLATKVTFMNELYDLYGGKDWDKLKKLLMTDKRLGTSHFDVPGPDGMRGFGGACFPKDTKGFLTYAEDGMNVLRSAVFTNKKWRSE
jgi:UDPglucose 6-dehydrogenase